MKKKYPYDSTRALLKFCAWVNKRINEDVLIGIFCVTALIIVFWYG